MEKTNILITWAVVYVVWYLLNAFGYRGEFKKAGISSGKAFIPFVREIEVYKMSWAEQKMGLIWCLSFVLGIVLLIVGCTFNIQILAWIGFIAIIAAQVMQIMRCFRQSKVFNRGGGMTAALIFVNPIANFVLGRSRSEYKGFQEA